MGQHGVTFTSPYLQGRMHADLHLWQLERTCAWHILDCIRPLYASGGQPPCRSCMLKQAEDVSTLHLSKLPAVWSMRSLKLLREPSQVNEADAKACVAASVLARCRPALYVWAEGSAVEGRPCCLLNTLLRCPDRMRHFSPPRHRLPSFADHPCPPPAAKIQS